MSATTPPFDDALIDEALDREESYLFDCKRLRDKLTKILETVVAFANSDGGTIALGLDDPDKASGRNRVFGIQENPMNWDELRRLMRSRITETDELRMTATEIGCTLRDGTTGSVIFLRVRKSTRIHSIVDDGTFIRLAKGNKQLTAPEINDLSFQRGTITAETTGCRLTSTFASFPTASRSKAPVSWRDRSRYPTLGVSERSPGTRSSFNTCGNSRPHRTSMRGRESA